jgi:alkylation response protein AidB-like acyl-CoA dehydrogenase
MGVVETAERLADELLFPTALATDAADAVPLELLDALADAGLYGLAGPPELGGAGDDLATTCAVIEALASGCLTTSFVWAQHLGATRAAIFSENEAMRGWVEPLLRGERRSGLALGGALPGKAQLVATQTSEGWSFDGSSPFVSGWERIDVIHTAARTDDDRIVWALVDAARSNTLTVERLSLAALDATNTVRAGFRAHPVPSERVTSVVPYAPGATPQEVLRVHASFALGVARRCCRLIGSTPLDRALAECRATLDRIDPQTIEADRAAAGELALRCAATLLVATGSRSLLRQEHAQRLAREAFFVLVYALRPRSREALLAQLDATPHQNAPR